MMSKITAVALCIFFGCLFLCGLGMQQAFLWVLAIICFGMVIIQQSYQSERKQELARAMEAPSEPIDVLPLLLLNEEENNTAFTSSEPIEEEAEPTYNPDPSRSHRDTIRTTKQDIPVRNAGTVLVGGEVPEGGNEREPKGKKQTSSCGAPIGKDVETGEAVFISQAARLQGLYLVGVNGTGKSTFISNLIEEDMKQGLGVCLLDPHGDLTKDVLSITPENRLGDVILLDLIDSSYPFGLNLFTCSDPFDPEKVALTAGFVMHVFEKVWDVGAGTPQLAQVLRNVTFTLIQNPGTTLAEIPLLLQDETVRERLVAGVKNNQVKLFWQTYNKLRPGEQLERTSSTLNKVDAFLTQPIMANIVGQSQTTLDFRKIMDEGKILLVQLSPQLEDMSKLVGAVIIGQLLSAAMSRRDVDRQERKQFNLYADEYQRFATEDFATLLTEARKFGVATTIAHQTLSQLDEKNRGASVNAANLVVFRVSGQDADELAKEFDATPEESLEVRHEPIRTPPQDVIGHLLRKGHREEFIKAYTDTWLAHLQHVWDNREQLIRVKDRYSILEQDELLKTEDLPFALSAFNRVLLNCMLTQSADVDITPMFFYMNAFFGRFSAILSPIVTYNPNPSSMGGMILSTLAEAPLRQNSKFTYGKEFTTLCSPSWEMYIERLGAVLCGNNREKREEFGRLREFIEETRLFMQMLAKDPILIDTGQYREVRDKPRPYADVQKEIANKLTNCPNYTARVKTLTYQATIKTLSPSEGIAGQEFEERRELVVDHTRRAYCRSRAEVEQETEERQEALLEEIEIKPKSRREKAE